MNDFYLEEIVLYEELEKKFDEYVSSYNLSQKHVALKNVHTHEVAKVMNLLCEKLKLNERDRYLALVIAFFHDAGRFPQLIETGSYSDFNYNHAIKSCEVIAERNVLEELGLNEEEKTLVNRAIFNHNRLYLEEDLNEREKLFSKMIRDADKIDIFRVAVDNFRDYFDDDPSPKVMEDFLLEKSIDSNDINNQADKIMQRLAFLYDINFKESFEILSENKYFILYVEDIKYNENKIESYNKVMSKTLTYYEGRILC